MKRFVRIIVTDSKGRFLVIREKKRPHRYTFPGGRVEKGEKYKSAAKRELLEETGIHGGKWSPLYQDGKKFMGPMSDKKSKGEFWCVTNYKGEPKIMEPNKCLEMKFVTIEEMEYMPCTPALFYNRAWDFNLHKKIEEIFSKKRS